MIVDCFTFYNEMDVLKRRLRYLNSVVDKFVLVESTVTHRGEPKELYYEKHKEEFSNWNDKIVHVVVRDNPDDKNPWSRENFQRNCITRGLEDVPNDAHIMISDVDEIPDKDFLTLPDYANVCSFNMVAFQYNFKYIQTHEPWFGTVMTRMTVLKYTTPQKLRESRWSVPHYRNAGWHLSSFGDENFVANKIHNYAHCHDDVSQDKDEAIFKKYIEYGIHADGKNILAKTPEAILNLLPGELKM